MLIVPALEYEKQRQDHTSWNKVILHREGKFYRVHEWSLWLVKKFVCTEEFQKQRGDDKMLSAKRYVGKKTGEYAMSGFPIESLSKYESLRQLSPVSRAVLRATIRAAWVF